MPYPTTSGGGGGSLTVAIRSDNSNPAVFADFAALNTYTGTGSGITDAARIRVSNPSQAREVFAVGTLNAQNQVTAITAAYIRLSGSPDTWRAVATNLVGSPGSDGADGADGTMLEFGSEAERDTFFSARLNMLRNNLPIMVTVATDTVSIQVWDGQTNPASYDSNLWRVASIRSGTASFELAEIHTISSGGENIFIRNELSGLNFFPPYQFLGDHSTTGTKQVSDTPTARLYSSTGGPGDDGFLFDTPAGAVAASGATGYDPTITLIRNESVHAIRVVAAEAYTGRLDYAITRQPSDIDTYTQAVDVDVAIGDDVLIEFPFPSETRSGAQIAPTLRKENGDLFNVRPVSGDATEPFVEIRFRTFVDGFLIVGERAASQLDPIILVEGGITKVVDEANNTITLRTGGGGQPEPRITTLSIQGQSTSVNPNTQLTGTLTFNYAVMLPGQVAGNLTLNQNGALLLNDVDPTGTSVTATITDVTLAAGESANFTLSGTSDSGMSFSRSFTVRATQPHEFAYHGIRATDDFSTVSLGQLSSTDITANDQFDVTGAFANTNVLGILVPSNMDLTRITTLGIPVTNTFTRTASPVPRVISGQDYILYTLTNSGGVDGQAAYTVEIR